MTLTRYCKAIPTPIDELNAIGKTQLEMFLGAYTPIFHKAVCETVNLMLSGEDFNKSQWNTHLQKTYGISKRHAHGVISSAKGAVDGAKECRILHRKTLENKAKSCESWLKKAERKLKLARKFYRKKTPRLKPWLHKPNPPPPYPPRTQGGCGFQTLIKPLIKPLLNHC